MNVVERAAIALCAAFLAMPAVPAAGSVVNADADGIIGVEQQCEVMENESLWEIARRFDIGINGISHANPGVDPFIPEKGTVIRIPSQWILPDVPNRVGIVINIPEFRLYYFPPKEPGKVITFPVGVGDEGKNTPVGSYTIVEKIINPPWNVPESIRMEQPELPKVVPPGPDNPMGSHALRLSMRTLLIHGTDRPWGIGTRSSHGCIRLFPEDIVNLYAMVHKGTRVVIVNQPVKVAVRGWKVYMEVHRYEDVDYAGRALRLLADKGLLERVDMLKLDLALEGRLGIPVEVTWQGSWSDYYWGSVGDHGPYLVHLPVGYGDASPGPVFLGVDIPKVFEPPGETMDSDSLAGVYPFLLRLFNVAQVGIGDVY
jgi:L,D-transpeptidase ErfK/SrfK